MIWNSCTASCETVERTPINRVVSRVGAIHVHEIRAGALAAHIQTGSRRCAGIGRIVTHNLRIRQREIDVVASVDRQVIDAFLIDGVRRRGACRLNKGGLRAYGDRLGTPGNAESESACWRNRQR